MPISPDKTICPVCAKLVPTAPEVCVFCGHELGGEVHAAAFGTPRKPITREVLAQVCSMLELLDLVSQ